MILKNGYIHVTATPDETLNFGESIASELKSGDILCLHGDLGAGKTHLVKGIASGLGVDLKKVNSPTFTLINEYPTTPKVYHFDLYRINSDAELLELGVDEYLFDDGICLIEWPEKMANFLPDDSVHVFIEKKSETERIFNIRIEK